MGYDGIVIALFVVLGIAFACVAVGASWFLSPSNKYDKKLTTYECGVKPYGPVWIKVRPGYYVYALLYVIFDIETVFLYPFALTFGLKGWFIFIEMVIFIAILVAGLIYAWKEGALSWR